MDGEMLKTASKFGKLDVDATEEETTPSTQIYEFDRNCAKVAAEKGCRVVYPESNQLQLDIDNEKSYADFERRVLSVTSRLQWQMDIKMTPSKSGLPHRHITITVLGAEFNDWQRVALQLMFGSDPVRESVNAMRCAAGVENPSCLFVPLREGE